MKKNVLTFRTPRFYSVEDEDVFFKWLYSIGAYKEVSGFGRELRLTLKSSRLSQKDRLQLVTLFQRYRINLKLLRPLLEPQEQWSKGLHWYASVFGTRPVYRSKRVS